MTRAGNSKSSPFNTARVRRRLQVTKKYRSESTRRRRRDMGEEYSLFQ
jgi:hypothetical protein